MNGSKKTILVTGGTGLVGNAIKFISNEYENEYNYIFISSKQYDLTIMDRTKDMFQKYKPNYVIHLAACVGGLFKNMNNKVEMLEKNLMINYNVVKCSHDYKVEKLIACLSTCIFPDNIKNYPIDESMLHEGPPHHSNDAYAYAKRMLEIHCRAYRENYGDNFTCIVPTNIYGPHDNFDLENGHVLPALIHKCFLAKKNNENFIIRGSGKPLRQFIFSHDLAKIIMIIFEKNITENIIISTPEENEISIGEIGYLIAENYDYKERVSFDTKYSDGQYKKTVGINNLKNILTSDFHFTDINDGIRITVEWFLQNYYQ
uniref:NAD-dependent epimerase/dehydratase domain-containing protein n=1 Tax=viral metagenome TaxID=1070528 RepID=A0A6C0KN81_9ZZZZ